MKENDYVGDYVNQMEFIAKELSNAGHPVSDKMQVTAILNSLPLLWEYVVTSLTLSVKDISMTSLPVLLVLEEERMKWRPKEGRATNLLMAQTTSQTSHAPTFRGIWRNSKENGRVNLKGISKTKEHATGVERRDILKQIVQRPIAARNKNKLLWQLLK
jgi:hypothetical protein